MAQELLFTTTFEHVSGMPEDRVVTTFPIAWTGAGSPTSGDLGQAFADLDAFWNTVQTTEAVAAYLSTEISRTAGSALLRAYSLVGHLDGSPHGSPISSTPMTPAAAGGSSDLPAEVAVVLTTRANGWEAAAVEAPDGVDPGTAVDRPRQRLSGRIFIGPLRNSAIGAGGTVRRVSSFMITDLLDAGEQLQTDLVADGFEWQVWSRVNAAIEPITHLQVDNAFDTQRRRGPDATVRTTRTL
jgi:hypothetical protein